MTPQQWTQAMADTVPWQVCYPEVARITRAWLAASPVAEIDTLSSQELVEAMFPENLAVGPGITARRRIFKALMALATRDLHDCCTRGPKQKMFQGGKSGPAIHPWRWHAPRKDATKPNVERIVRCPHCGEEIL